MDTIIVFGKGLAGGALAGGLDWGVSKAPVGGLGQGAILFGVGLLSSLAVAKWVDPVVAGGLAGGTGLALVNRTRRYIALKDLGKPASKENGKTNNADAVFTMRREASKVHTVADAGRVFRARRDAGNGIGPFPGARTMPVTSLGAKSFKSDQQRDAAGSVYVQNGRRYGPTPQNWTRHVIEAGRSSYRDDSGRVIRVRGAYN